MKIKRFFHRLYMLLERFSKYKTRRIRFLIAAAHDVGRLRLIHQWHHLTDPEEKMPFKFKAWYKCSEKLSALGKKWFNEDIY